MSLIEIVRDQPDNPLDVVEHMAAGNNWPFERAGEDEIGIVVTGRWTNYQVRSPGWAISRRCISPAPST